MSDIPTSTDDLDALEAESLLARFASEVRELGDLLARAREVQWTAPPRTTVPAERKGVNHKPNAPTEDIALDTQRLALRVNVLATERALRTAALHAIAMRLALQDALRPYEG